MGRARYFTPRSESEPTFVVVLANPDDPELADFDALYETTAYPRDLLFGPGAW